MRKHAFATIRNLKYEYSEPVPNLTKPPQGTLPLHTIERICKERIAIYHAMSKISLSHERFTVDWNTAVLTELQSNFFDTYNVCTGHGKTLRDLKIRIGRYFMYYVAVNCISNNIGEWIIDNEINLFRLLFSHCTLSVQEDFVFKNRLINKRSSESIDVESYPYEVSWKCVLNLISTRKVPLEKGKAYVDASHFIQIASNFQLENVLKYLSVVKIGLPIVKLDLRVCALIENLQSVSERCVCTLNQDKWSSALTRKVNLSNVDDLAAVFPPCMERIHHRLETKHHIRYNSRIQFMPFLKDIGLSLNDMSHYFHEHFTQLMTENEFKKKRYNYQIRYQYGLEGRKIEQKTKNCRHIMRNSHEKLLDCHGCPLLSVDTVKELFSLPSYSSVHISDKDEILSLAGKMSANRICAKILSLKHFDTTFDSVVHPMQYYAKSSNQNVDESSDSSDA